MHRDSGFTLIELLIVIAVIVILAATLIPSLLNARRNAVETSAKLYGRQLVQWIAAADTAGLIGNGPGQVDLTGDNCKHSILQDEGAPSDYPKAIQSCQINFDAGDGKYSIVITAASGRSVTVIYWLR